MNKVLIAGGSGLVGFAAARHFGNLNNWKVVAISRRIPSAIDKVTYVSVDLLDKQRCREVFGQMTDVTHPPDLRGAVRKAGACSRLERPRPDGNQSRDAE